MHSSGESRRGYHKEKMHWAARQVLLSRTYHRSKGVCCVHCPCHGPFLSTVRPALFPNWEEHSISLPCRVHRPSLENSHRSVLCSPAYSSSSGIHVVLLKVATYHFLELILSIVFIFPLYLFLFPFIHLNPHTYTQPFSAYKTC